MEMMIGSAREYHRKTTYKRHSLGGHLFDWSNQPDVYKEYPDAEQILLPRELPEIDKSLSDVIMQEAVRTPHGPPLSLGELGCILLMACGLTAKARHSRGEFFYRSVPSAGALYPCEVYVASSSLDELPDGLYHYSVGRHALAKLREGRITKPDRDSAAAYELLFFVTVVFFRSAWKYHDRSYRYLLLDSGHLIENLALALRAFDLPFRVMVDFEEGEVNSILGIDPDGESSLAVIAVQSGIDSAPPEWRKVEDLPEKFKAASRVARREVHYPLLREIHTLSARAGAWSEEKVVERRAVLEPPLWEKVERPSRFREVMNYSEAVFKRRSRRNFVARELSREELDGLIHLLCAPDLGSFKSLYDSSVHIGFLAQNCEGLPSGIYMIDRANRSIGRVRSGSYNRLMAHICVDQDWLAQAALQFFFLIDFEQLEETRGARGYRYAMFTAGRLAQRLYLGATAMGLGCCGIGAFYDEEASELLELKDSAAMLYLVAVGPVKKMN